MVPLESHESTCKKTCMSKYNKLLAFPVSLLRKAPDRPPDRPSSFWVMCLGYFQTAGFYIHRRLWVWSSDSELTPQCEPARPNGTHGLHGLTASSPHRERWITCVLVITSASYTAKTARKRFVRSELLVIEVPLWSEYYVASCWSKM